MEGPIAALSRDGTRLHLQHGPIDLIVEADCDAADKPAVYGQLWQRFQTVLDELVYELPTLRLPVGQGPSVTGPVAVRMVRAVQAHPTAAFVTPMAAVAGAVADEMCDVLAIYGQISRAYINNGGDIALRLTPGTCYEVGLVPVPDEPRVLGKTTIYEADPVRGIATSGRHGRSHSLGIADAVTVLAQDAASADVAATLIANAVDIPGHPGIGRTEATRLDPDSDLGERLVTVSVGHLEEEEIVSALTAGTNLATAMIEAGSIAAAVVCLQGHVTAVGTPRGVLDNEHRTSYTVARGQSSSPSAALSWRD